MSSSIYGRVWSNTKQQWSLFCCFAKETSGEFSNWKGVEAGRGGEGVLVNKTVGRVEVRKRDRPLGNLSNV